MLLDVAQAKGSNMHHMRTWVTARGESAWAELLSTMSPSDHEELLGLVPVGWYDLELQHRLLRAIDTRFGTGSGSLVRAIGRFEADQDLTIVHRMFLRLANPAYVLEKAGDYWSRFYDTGTWTVRRESKNRASGVLVGIRPFDPFFAQYLEAYIERMWELVGAKSLQVRAHLDADQFHIEGSWR